MGEPFLLNQNTPEEGVDIETYLYNKYGSRGVQAFHDPDSHLFTSGRKVGIEFLKKRNVYPTIKAHSLMEYAKEQQDNNDAANQIMEELFHRYFEKGENINCADTLVDIASKTGLDKQATVDAIGDDKFQCMVNEKD